MRDFFSFPALIDIDLTQKCNLGCEFCSISAGENCNDNDELKVNEYKVLFDELHENHVHRISLGGGVENLF